MAGAGGSYLDALTQLQVNGVREPWTFGYLIDVILTRDPWMHRLDIAAATGTPPRLTWQAGANGPSWTLDAVDFCRAISRRPASITLDELLNTEVPY